MRKGQMRAVFSTVDKIQNDQSGITGLETAIVLIAFIVVAAVFAFAVLTTGLVTTEKTKETAQAALGETQSTLTPKGTVIAEGGDAVVNTIRFKLANAAGTGGVDLAPAKTLLTYTDDNQSVGITYLASGTCADPNKACWNSVWRLGSGNTVDPGEIVEFTIDLTNLATSLTSNERFKIEVIPSQGAVVPISRAIPLELKNVMNLN